MSQQILIQNRKARHNYQLLEHYEAGIVLQGSEVKSLRTHRGSLSEAFVIDHGGELFLHNCHIPPYGPATHFGHKPLQDRKLLLHKRQVRKILGQIARKGITVVPTKCYLNARGKIKVDIALAAGLKAVDKRHALKEKEWQRDKHRLMKVARGENA